LGEVSRSESPVILRVLLVEASDRGGQRLLDALDGGGFGLHSQQVCERSHLDTALRDETWDVVLLSCALPGLPPQDVVNLLKELALVVPVILTLEHGMLEFPFELLENGACDFVFKSNPARLLAVVERECTRARLSRHEHATLVAPETFDRIDEGIARFSQLASNVPECYWLVDASTRKVTYVSNGYEQIWGRSVEALYADSRDWLNYVHDDDRSRVVEAVRANRQGGMDVKFRVQRPSDSMRWLHARNFPVHDESGEIVSIGGVASDITCLLAEKWKTPYFAHFDALTALPNQLMFYDQVQRMVALSKRNNLPLSLMVVDIDRFRELNQTLGHTSGDELLRQVAGRLSGSLRDSDILGRLGGDVFGVLLPDMADNQQASIVARRIIDTLIMPVRVDGQDVFATASVGIVFFPRDGRNVHELVSNARIAVSHAKRLGRNSYQYYSAGMHDEIRDRLLLETDLRNATLRNEFLLYYQPKASCANGRITGTEALIRWQHPRRGIVPPDQFIPLLEETGLIVQVGRWVLEEACRQIVEWQAAGLDIPSVSVNLSARQLQSDTLLADVAAVLHKSGLKPACLDLEITESMLMHNAEAAICTLTALKGMGVTISLDDFGTGYSSLAYLKRFPLDAVKVDRSFVQDIAADSDDASITRAVITMAHHLKLKVVAEGVETPEQLSLLISHQCDIIQGYFFSRPLAATGMTDMLVIDKRLPMALLRSGTRKPMALFVAVDGFEEVISMLARDGHRVCTAPDLQGAMQWFSGNLVDILVCGAPHKGFDAVSLIQLAAAAQPKCERILLADSKQWGRKPVVELSSSGLVSRVIHLPIEPAALRQVVEETLGRRHISDEYSRLSHEVEVAERELLRIEEERSRLIDENKSLQAQERQGFNILQEVLTEVPWPIFGIDESGLIALANDAAFERFATRGAIPGATLESVLPEILGIGHKAKVKLDGVEYICRWRQIELDGSGDGRLLFLEGSKK
jgi:diguanylate cyclase (GGDEF)-like protein/PAS domain S-box-containing protein